MVYAAATPRVTPKYSGCTQSSSFEDAVSLNSLYRVGRTRRIVTTPRCQQRRNESPVGMHWQQYDRHEEPFHRAPASSGSDFFKAATNRRSKYDAKSRLGTSLLAANARTTILVPAGKAERRSAIRCLRRRFTRFRAVALGISLFPTTMPAFAASFEEVRSRDTTKTRLLARVPFLRTGPNPSCLVSRLSTRNTSTMRPKQDHTEILARPLRRRFERIERPARVRMRKRKPCTLWRRRLFGW